MDSIEVADVFRQFGPSYIDAFGAAMPRLHRRAIEDITACRTQAMGGHLHQCGDCGEYFHVYHGCRSRSCPACHTRQTEQWLQARKDDLLPCPYYHVCVTVPAELRELFRANQAPCYGLLMKAAADAVRDLCRDTRYMGATPAILAVLHTWTARMHYHPHVHMLVSAGGLCEDKVTWREARQGFLIPVRALSTLVRAKLRAALQKNHPGLFQTLPHDLWDKKKKWVAWCRPWGQSHNAVLDYLARYVHRIAISNARILRMDEHTVTFRYKGQKTETVKGHEFMRRFLQHVPPKGFHKVRYYGLWSSGKRPQRDAIRLAIALNRPPTDRTEPEATGKEPPLDDLAAQTETKEPKAICPYCKSANTRLLERLKPRRTQTSARASPAHESREQQTQ